MSSKLDAIFDGYPELMSTSDAAKILGLTKQALYGWLRDGKIPGYKLGNTWFVVRDELKEALLQGANSAATRCESLKPKESDDER